MFRDLRHGVDISQHHFQNVYVYKTGKNRSQASDRPGMICSMRSNRGEPNSEEEDTEASSKYRPITFSCDGEHMTFRPWNPYSCGIAAGISNSLIHFPISPGSRVFAIDCSLQTLSHFADIVGRSGYIIGVMSDGNPKKPDTEQLTKFVLKHPRVSVVSADVHNVNLEHYERLLSLPASSKYAFLMAMHPRLGENSPARTLAEESKSISKHIFDFLECRDAAKVKNLVVCHWSSNLEVHSICNVLLNHVDILKKWNQSSSKRDDAKTGVSGKGEDNPSETEGLHEASERDVGTAGSSGVVSDDAADKKKKKKKEKRESGKSDKVPRWILLDVAIDNFMKDSGAGMLSELAANMKRTPDGRRTGAWVKEQLLLRPYLPNRALLLFKYGADGDGHRKGIGHRLPVHRDKGDIEPEPQPVNILAPSSATMPTPAFLGGGGSSGPGAAPGLGPSWNPFNPGMPPGIQMMGLGGAPGLESPLEAQPPPANVPISMLSGGKQAAGPKANPANWDSAILSGLPTGAANRTNSQTAPTQPPASQLDRKAASGEQRRQKGVKADHSSISNAAANAPRGKERDRAAQQYMALEGGMPPAQGRRPHVDPESSAYPPEGLYMGGDMWQPGPGELPQAGFWGGGPGAQSGPGGSGYPQQRGAGGGGGAGAGGGGGGAGAGAQPFYQGFGGPPGLPPGLSPAQLQGMGKGGWQGQQGQAQRGGAGGGGGGGGGAGAGAGGGGGGGPDTRLSPTQLQWLQRQQQQQQGGRNYGGGKGKDGGGGGAPMPPSDGYWQF